MTWHFSNFFSIWGIWASEVCRLMERTMQCIITHKFWMDNFSPFWSNWSWTERSQVHSLWSAFEIDSGRVAPSEDESGADQFQVSSGFAEAQEIGQYWLFVTRHRIKFSSNWGRPCSNSRSNEWSFFLTDKKPGYSQRTISLRTL